MKFVNIADEKDVKVGETEIKIRRSIYKLIAVFKDGDGKTIYVGERLKEKDGDWKFWEHIFIKFKDGVWYGSLPY